GVRPPQIAHLRRVPAAQVGAPRLEDDPLAQEPERRKAQLLRQQRKAGVEVEDVELRNRPGEGAELLRQVQRQVRALARVAELDVDVEAALERALVEDEQRALDAELP